MNGTFNNGLYILSFLHQTATVKYTQSDASGCISYLSYIKPQLAFRIKSKGVSCISYLSYIKPQQSEPTRWTSSCCISYLSYIKPQHEVAKYFNPYRCISYLSYIKPQLIKIVCIIIHVVYLIFPTSNRNLSL